jgi:hypothetical protein
VRACARGQIPRTHWVSFDSGDISGASASFYQWGAANGTCHAAGSGYPPQPGDVVIYGLNSAGTNADRVAIVTSYSSGAAGPDVVNGDWWSSGLYTDAPDGTPHDVLGFTSSAGGVIKGSVSFLYQDQYAGMNLRTPLVKGKCR